MDAPADAAQLALEPALYRILRSLARICLRHGFGVPAFLELTKRAFIEAAQSDFNLPGRKPSASRVSILTGLTRKEVHRLESTDAVVPGDVASQYNRAARVVAGWVRDESFHDTTGGPASLSFDGEPVSFSELVRRYSGDVPPRAVLDELLRVGAVEREESGRLRLLSRVYIPRVSDREKLQILGNDVADLITTIDHNLQSALPRFQRKVMYDNLPLEAVAEFRGMAGTDAQALIERMDAWLSRQDRDVDPRVRGTGRMRAGIGIYYFEEDLEHHQE